MVGWDTMEAICKNTEEGFVDWRTIVRKRCLRDDLVQDRDHWRALVKVALNLQVT